MPTCKLGEKGCWKDGKCHYSHDCENKVLTNADRIRAMSDEELARFIYGLLANYENRERNTKYWVEWLKQPAGGEACGRAEPGVVQA